MALKMLLLLGRFFNKFLKVLIPLYIASSIALGVYLQFFGSGVNLGMVINAVIGVFTLMLFGSLDYWFMSRKVNCKWCGEVFMLCDTKQGVCKSCRLYSAGPSGGRRRESRAEISKSEALDYKQLILAIVAVAGLTATAYLRSAVVDDSPSNSAMASSATLNDSTKSEKTHVPQSTGEFVDGKLWEGKFGNAKIQIYVGIVDPSGIVKGYNILKGKKRDLTGSLRDGVIVLNEPGDDPWDGVFELKMNETTCTGNWASNNGKLRRHFVLSKVN